MLCWLLTLWQDWLTTRDPKIPLILLHKLKQWNKVVLPNPTKCLKFATRDRCTAQPSWEPTELWLCMRVVISGRMEDGIPQLLAECWDCQGSAMGTSLSALLVFPTLSRCSGSHLPRLPCSYDRVKPWAGAPGAHPRHETSSTKAMQWFWDSFAVGVSWSWCASMRANPPMSLCALHAHPGAANNSCDKPYTWFASSQLWREGLTLSCTGDIIWLYPQRANAGHLPASRGV